MLKLRDADTGESELECYTIPEGKCLTFGRTGIGDEWISIILTPEQVRALVAELVAT